MTPVHGLRAEWVNYCRQRQQGHITQEQLLELYQLVCTGYSCKREDSLRWYFRRKQMKEELMQSHRKDYTITPEVRLPVAMMEATRPSPASPATTPP